LSGQFASACGRIGSSNSRFQPGSATSMPERRHKQGRIVIPLI
jgi:hypothetical protein